MAVSETRVGTDQCATRAEDASRSFLVGCCPVRAARISVGRESRSNREVWYCANLATRIRLTYDNSERHASAFEKSICSRQISNACFMCKNAHALQLGKCIQLCRDFTHTVVHCVPRSARSRSHHDNALTKCILSHSQMSAVDSYHTVGPTKV